LESILCNGPTNQSPTEKIKKEKKEKKEGKKRTKKIWLIKMKTNKIITTTRIY
jgi:hypothetical protein|tara:strand:+ start:680 stop:838 length:159 start_codon:yes stop_codon:yes gene_type:complete